MHTHVIKKDRAFSLIRLALSVSAKKKGVVRIKNSPKTLGFSKVDTTRPLISENIFVSCQDVEALPERYCRIPYVATISVDVSMAPMQRLAQSAFEIKLTQRK